MKWEFFEDSIWRDKLGLQSIQTWIENGKYTITWNQYNGEWEARWWHGNRGYFIYSNHYINKCKEACTKHLRNMLKGIKIRLGKEAVKLWEPEKGEWVWAKDQNSCWVLVKYVEPQDNGYYCLYQNGYYDIFKEIIPFEGKLPVSEERNAKIEQFLD